MSSGTNLASHWEDMNNIDWNPKMADTKQARQASQDIHSFEQLLEEMDFETIFRRYGTDPSIMLKILGHGIRLSSSF